MLQGNPRSSIVREALQEASQAVNYRDRRGGFDPRAFDVKAAQAALDQVRWCSVAGEVWCWRCLTYRVSLILWLPSMFTTLQAKLKGSAASGQKVFNVNMMPNFMGMPSFAPPPARGEEHVRCGVVRVII